MIRTGRGVPAGKYKRLIRNNMTVMSNTPDEINDIQNELSNLTGKVLINGLGLGVTIKFLLEHMEVEKITVIELSQAGTNLVAPTYSVDPRVEIIQADCFTWTPPKGVIYDFIWQDIWDDICTDNIEEMKTLHRKYGKRTHRQASWCRYRCERPRKEEKEQSRWYHSYHTNPFE